MSGVGFLYSSGLWFLFTVEIYPVGGVGQLVCQGFLVREACVSVLVCGNGFFSLEHNGVFSNEFCNESMC